MRPPDPVLVQVVRGTDTPGAHIARAGRLADPLPNGLPGDSPALCGATGRAAATPATSIRRAEWCAGCLAAYRAEGHGAAEPAPREAARPW